MPIIEDDPYGLLRFKGTALPSLYELTKGRGVVYMSTFSKLLSPGIRLGLLLAEDAVMKQLLYAKHAGEEAADETASDASESPAEEAPEAGDQAADQPPKRGPGLWTPPGT